MTEQTRQLKESVEAVRKKYKTLLKRTDNILKTIESGTLFKTRDITYAVRDLSEFDRLQKHCLYNYGELFGAGETKEIKLNEIERKAEEYDVLYFRTETDCIAEKFKNLRSDNADCQALLEMFAEKLESISINDKSIEEYKASVGDYIRLYSLTESDDKAGRVQFSKENTVFSDYPELLLRFIQGKIRIE